MNETKKAYQIISGSTLKLIAVITMLIDHIGASCIEQGIYQKMGQVTEYWYHIDRVLRWIGRLSFPIFCFLLVEGMLHTHNKKKYIVRLLLFGVVSEVPFDLAFFRTPFYANHTNVYFTLLIGLIVIIGVQYAEEKLRSTVGVIMQICIVVIGMAAAELLKTDYSAYGVFLIALLYVLRKRKNIQAVAGAASLYWELPAPLAFIPILFYNGKRGFRMKYFFYAFYPVHLLILAIITNYVIL